ncbi:transporter substrate-binding domain-containing protein [Sedimentibacter sp. zth1]|uniref:methyl-accepting chemotaxis protein n=1 Tax=Sedimentibacter sp. zth1 TaxID=2816908 RepID=UPI001A92A47A|nr:transporter substrate-binding domain-containing protein [Sedimentibacter sp. zth1]QSX07222.1 transporter substrate-binding domain-containing protein [Sedimentibacter sp. zth1]
MKLFKDTSGKKEEIIKITNNADKVIRKSIEKISKTSNTISEINTEINNISNKADNLVCGADRQSENIVSIVTELDTICDYADNTLNKTTELSNNSKLTYEKVVQNREEIEYTINEFDQVKEDINNTSSVAQDLQKKVEYADSLVVAVEGITKQTKILSVNASIEAARAGVHGKGFGVVAEEIMKVSEQTANVNKKVDDIIKEIGKLSENMQNAMSISIDKIINQSTKLKKAVSEFNEIENATREYSENNMDLASNSRELNDKFYKIKERVNSISEIIKDNKKSTIDVTKSIKHELEHFDKLSSTIENVEDKMIESLQLTNKVSQHDNNIIIAGISPYPPYAMCTKDGDMIGIDCDIIKEAFKDTDIKVQFMMCTWDGSLKLLKNNLIDMITTVSCSKERESYMNFSKPYREKSKYLFYSLKKSDVSINSYDDLYKYKIGVQNFKYNSRFDTDDKLNKDNTAIDLDTIFKKLFKGQIDTIIANEYAANYYIKDSGLGEYLNVQKYCFTESNLDERMAFCKKPGIDQYVKIFDDNVEKMVLDGTIKKIESKYL